MKIHWRTEDRWLRDFKAGQALADIAWEYAPWEPEDAIAERVVIDEVKDAIRHAILRQERKRGSRAV